MNSEGAEITSSRQAAKAELKDVKRTVSFISKERDHKFDLLLHLITNLRQPLLVCGPVGIGKSRVLKQIDAARSSHWTICHLSLSRGITADSLFKMVLSDLSWEDKNSRGSSSEETLAQKLNQLSSQKKLLVLLLDNAGEMPPGVITSLVKFAEINQALRLVVAMTVDQLQVKESTDPSILDFHVVELPPLNEQQCGDFLRNISTGPGAILSLKAINPLLVQTVYQETDGIPGKIKQMIPVIGSSGAGFVIKKQMARFKFSIMFFVLLFILVAGYGAWRWFGAALSPNIENVPQSKNENKRSVITQYSEDDENIENPIFRATPLPEPLIADVGEPKKEGVENSAFSGERESSKQNSGAKEDDKLDASEDVGEEPELETLSDKDKAAPNDAGVEVIPLIDSVNQSNDKVETLAKTSEPTRGDETATTLESTHALDEAKSSNSDKESLVKSESDDASQKVEKKVESALQASSFNQQSSFNSSGVLGASWLAEQDPQKYTIQLIALSSEKATIKLVKQYPHLQPLAYFRSPRKKGELFPIFYGSFQTQSEAIAAQKQIPSKFGKGWMRRFSSVHQEMKRANN